MQNITAISKYLTLVVMSCGLILLSLSNLQQQNNSFGAEEVIATQLASLEVLPAPVAVALPAKSVWQHIADNFKLDHQIEKKQVQAEIRKLLANQSRLYDILHAAGPYIHFIFSTTKTYNLPGELALIPFIESEFNPNDRSSKGATGLWQLMPQTARGLGVKVKAGYDGRRNIIASTHAALTYFNDLINNFGDWYLAIAAYNAGPGKVSSATKKSGTQTFWNLRLPRETRLYVPKLLAVSAIIADPEKYGVELPPITNEPYFAEMTMKNAVTLDKMAKTTGVNIKTLKKLNPDVKHLTISQKNGEHKVLVPVRVTPLSEKVTKSIELNMSK